MLFEEMALEGILKPSHWTGNVLESAHKGLSELYYSKNIPLGLSYSDNIDLHSLWYGQDVDFFREKNLVPKSHTVGHISLFNDGRTFWEIGSKVAFFESVKPGLGISLYHTLIDAFGSTIDSVNPERIFEFAQMVHWEGWEDEHVALEDSVRQAECFLDPETQLMRRPEGEEEIKAMMKAASFYRRRDFDLHYPKWSFDSTSRDGVKLDYSNVKLDGSTVNYNPSCLDNFDAVQIATMVEYRLDHWKKLPRWESFHQTRFSEVSTPIVLRMSKHDDTIRISDDIGNIDQQSDCMMDVCYGLLFDSQNPSMIREAFKRITSLLSLLGAIELLLLKIGEPINESNV